jgi:hypothetical protein
LLASPLFSGVGAASTLHLLLVLEYNSLFMPFQFSWGGVSICPGAALDYVPVRGGKGVMCGACGSPVRSVGFHRQL